MAYIETWDETKPAGTRALSLGDDDIRELKRALRERFAAGGMHFPSTDDSNAGLFDNVKFIEQSSNPTSEANRGFLFTKDVSGITELYWMDSSGNVIQLTSAGKILITSLFLAGETRGDLIVRGASAWQRLPIGTNGQVLKSDGTDPSWGTPAVGGVQSGAVNLRILSASNSTVTLTADNVSVADSSGNTALSGSINKTLDITASGANGLDTGSEAASTWYYIWAIRKSTDGTVAGLFSTSATAPTMPSGYDQKALVGVVRNDSSSNFIGFRQTGKIWTYLLGQTLVSGAPGMGSWTAIDTSGFVPSGVSEVAFGEFAMRANTVLFSNRNDRSLTANGAIDTNRVNMFSNYSSKELFWRFLIETADTLYWASNDAQNTIYIDGFELTKLA